MGGVNSLGVVNSFEIKMKLIHSLKNVHLMLDDGVKRKEKCLLAKYVEEVKKKEDKHCS